jgi:signal transduction histidine kinase
LVETFSPVVEENGKVLVSRLDTPLPVQGDRDLLVQMIVNLLDNALQHTPPGTRIEVVGESGAKNVSLAVADNGPGVPANERNVIFQRYHRSEASRGSPGTGLGLSLVAAIAQLHGFECLAADNGPGLRVTLTLAEAPQG